MDPISILTTVKASIAAGRTVASLSKELGQFFDATDNAKKKLQQKGVSGSNVNAIAMERFAKLRQAAEAEEELKKFISETLGPSHWQTLLKLRREVLQEKREAEAQARREAIERQELAITIVGIIVLLVFTFVGASAYLHYMQWIDIRDWLR
jgi:tRNA isopentenyl-2-thiomethyl-A-37 hydroxylase MiaE